MCAAFAVVNLFSFFFIVPIGAIYTHFYRY